MNKLARSLLAVALGACVGLAYFQASHARAEVFYGEVDADGRVRGTIWDDEPVLVRERASTFGTTRSGQWHRYDRYYDDGTHEVQRVFCTGGPGYEDCRTK